MFDCVIQNTTKKVHKSSKLFQFSEISLVLMDFYANVDLVDTRVLEVGDVVT